MTDDGTYRVLVIEPEDDFVKSAEKVLSEQTVLVARTVASRDGWIRR